jgi:hypothetical protein
LEEGQQMIRDAITTYLANPAPDHVLLIAAPAGIGKTTIAVETAETCAAGAGRVLYLGPRRDFFSDLQALMQRPSWWYNWLPRTLGQGQGAGQTCRYASHIEQWMRRGYPALDFCANPRICGWSYIHQQCAWHAQAHRSEPIIYAQYEHLALGHPRLEQTDLLIGDELPLRAFLHPWHIPAGDMIPAGMDEGPREQLMRGLRRLAMTPREGGVWSGPALLAALGGARLVAQACGEVALAEIEPPELRHADAAEQAPYGHLFHTLYALKREAEAQLAGVDAIPRVRIDTSGLTLLLRRRPRFLPPHVIWLDATASGPLYRELLNRSVKIVRPDVQLQGRVRQVWASLNTKTDVGPAADGRPKLQHVQAQVAAILNRGYQRPAYVTYKDLLQVFGANAAAAHFHGSRGTNRLQNCDCLIVIGTPQPGTDDVVTTATMVYSERDRPFDVTWTTQDRPFPGQPWAYPVAGFWNDHDLQVLLEQVREAELVQALHRARPLRRSVDVWLLTNVPLPGIPVELVSLHQLFDAPDGVDPYRWPEVLRVATARAVAVGRVTTQDFTSELKTDRKTATKWFEGLLAQGWREIEPVPSATRGPFVRACVNPLRSENRGSVL